MRSNLVLGKIGHAVARSTPLDVINYDSICKNSFYFKIVKRVYRSKISKKGEIKSNWIRYSEVAQSQTEGQKLQKGQIRSNFENIQTTQPCDQIEVLNI